MKKSKKQKAIEHYDRMIAWAETQKSKQEANNWIMYNTIKEDWYGESCPYCQNPPKSQILCKLGHCFYCCDGLWSEMVFSITWKSWIKNAKKVRQYIIDKG